MATFPRPRRRPMYNGHGAVGAGRHYRDLQRLWLVRMLLKAGLAPCELDELPSVHVPRLFTFLGISHRKTEPEFITKAQFSRMLGRVAARVGERPPARDDVLNVNLGMLCEKLALNEVEREILLFVTICALEETFKAIAMHVAGGGARGQISRFLSDVLTCDPQAVMAALDRDAPLVRCRLIRLAGDGHGDVQNHIDLMNGLEHVLSQDHASAEALLEKFFCRSPGATLTADDFPHLAGKIETLGAYLTTAVRERRRGVNVMLYGAPGTGKTELARLLAKTVGTELYEVRVTDEDDDGITSSRRFTSFQLCQRLLGRSRDSMVLFDECEDVFPCEEMGFFGIRMKSGHEKGFTNRLLEENPVPAIWISNAVGQIDPAFMRRFDIHLEVKPPPRSVRRRVIERYLGEEQLGAGWKDRIASCEGVTPADIESASRVVRMLGVADATAFEKKFEEVLKDRLMARGERFVVPEHRIDPATYSVAYLNADQDLGQLAGSLQGNPAGTICLYGPPGTGKTAFGHYLADRLKKPLHVRRASDILSMWVGGTEKNIAKMFAQARDDDAILLLDEADSFLQDRRGAVRQWEVTQVNELLVRMEEFEGLFICSTNLIDNLDQASFRRFAIKVKFDYLKPEQAWAMFTADLSRRGHRLDTGSDETGSLMAGIRRLETLTPGDFATVSRKLSILKRETTPRQHLDLLEDECRAKKDGEKKKAMGF